MIFYFLGLLKTLIDLIRCRVFPQEQTEQQTETECDQPTESIECSCPTVISKDHPVDLKRLLELYNFAYETLDPLFHILDPIDVLNAVPHPPMTIIMCAMLSHLTRHCAMARFYAKKATEDVEKLLRNEPVYQGLFHEITREERTYGLTREIRSMNLLIRREQEELQQILL